MSDNRTLRNKEHRIPGIFYQCWDMDLPEIVHSQNRRFLPPGVAYRRFGLADIRKYLRSSWGGRVLRVFDSLRAIPHKVDLWRYCVLYDTGGIYMDADCILLAPLAQLVDNSDCFFVSNDRDIRNIFNGFLGTYPGNPIYREIIDFMVRTGNDFDGDYYYNCQELYRIVNRHVPIAIGRFDYPGVTFLWDSCGEDGWYYAFYKSTKLLVETNPHYPYPGQSVSLRNPRAWIAYVRSHLCGLGR